MNISKRLEKALQLIEFGLQEIKEIKAEIEGQERRANSTPNPLPPSNTRGRIPQMTEEQRGMSLAQRGAHRRKVKAKFQRKAARLMSDSYIKTAIKATREWKDNRIEITPEMIELKREQLKLKRGIHEEQQLTEETVRRLSNDI